MKDEKLFQKLMASTKAAADGCIEWTGFRHPTGYGSMSRAKGTRSVHRLMYMAIHGPIPKGLFVLHSCDNPPCINPDHLSLGTNTENINQCVKRDRHYWTNKTHCRQGHEYAGDNLYVCSEGRRHCRACSRLRHRLRAGWPAELARTAPVGYVGFVPPSLKRVAPPKVRKRKSTHCGKGHELAGANRYVNTRGYVNCRRCQQDARVRFAKRRSSLFETFVEQPK